MYTDTTATALKLIRNDRPDPAGCFVIAADISPDSTRFQFLVDVTDNDTLYFALQAANRDHVPTLFSELTPWILWTYKSITASPGPIAGFGIVAVEIVNP